jgi:hypothetical protein
VAERNVKRARLKKSASGQNAGETRIPAEITQAGSEEIPRNTGQTPHRATKRVRTSEVVDDWSARIEGSWEKNCHVFGCDAQNSTFPCERSYGNYFHIACAALGFDQNSITKGEALCRHCALQYAPRSVRRK